jgi:hypothetical protein
VLAHQDQNLALEGLGAAGAAQPSALLQLLKAQSATGARWAFRITNGLLVEETAQETGYGEFNLAPLGLDPLGARTLSAEMKLDGGSTGYLLDVDNGLALAA